jgi:hypothetical protein
VGSVVARQIHMALVGGGAKSMTDYNRHSCPKCGARLHYIEADFTKNVVIYRPCRCEATLLADDEGREGGVAE